MTEQQRPFGGTLAQSESTPIVSESQQAFTPATDESEIKKVLTHTDWVKTRDHDGYERLFDYVSLQLSYIQEIIDVSYQSFTDEDADSLLSLIDFTVKNVTQNINGALGYEAQSLGYTAIKTNPNRQGKVIDAVRVLPQTPNEAQEWEELSGFFRNMKAQESEKSVRYDKERDFLRAARNMENRVENFMGYIKAMESLLKLSDTSDVGKSVFHQMCDELTNRLKKAFAEANS